METSEIAIRHEDIAISVKNLNFSYNHQKVLDSINIDIKKGEFLGLIGPNGSGKTTFLKLLLGLLKIETGTIEIDREKIGYVAQKAGSQIFDFPITASELVSMGLTNTNGGKTKIEKALEAVEMLKAKNKLVNELSGGQQQRVFIARALVSNPEILILDEPTSGVDASSQVSFYNLLKKLNKDFKITLILVSHDIDVVIKEVTTIMCLNGKLICHLSVDDFDKKEYTQNLDNSGLRHVVHHHHA